jgi:hypothetical protein
MSGNKTKNDYNEHYLWMSAMKKISLIIILLLFIFRLPVMSGQVYQWIDENGVKHFTNEPPPEGATIIDKDKEIQYDEAKDRQRMKQDEQSFKELEQKYRSSDKESVEKAPTGKEEPGTAIIQVEEGDTWHQDRIEKRERIKNRPRKRR